MIEYNPVFGIRYISYEMKIFEICTYLKNLFSLHDTTKSTTKTPKRVWFKYIHDT